MDNNSTNYTQNSMIRITEKEFIRLWQFIKQNYGIDLSKKKILIEGRMTHELRSRQINSFDEYIDILLSDNTGTEITTLLNKVTTNLSYFSREKEHFEYLSQVVLPFLERTNAKNKTLNIWSAGCSTGQEPYNIAITINDYFGKNKHLWDTRILATDISEKVLSKAIKGRYTAEECENIPAQTLLKHFTPANNNCFEVTPQIKKEVIFKPFNLMDDFPFKKPFDIIFCRNTMIYFDSPTKAKLIGKFFNSTKVGGHLFIGHSESLSIYNQFAAPEKQYAFVKSAVYQRRA